MKHQRVRASYVASRTGNTARYALCAFTVVYLVAMVDRGVFGILSQDIKLSLRLTDYQLGLLGGIAFALLYGGLSIPIARLAERWNRVSLLSSLVALWSVASAISGVATSFLLMALARSGVGAGEAGLHPCAQSLIADYYPPTRRSTATAVYSLAIPLGTMIGVSGGAYLSAIVGWRWTFAAVGVPGVVIAIILRATLREPRRGAFDPPREESIPGYGAVIRHLVSRRTFNYLCVGWVLTAAGWSSTVQFFAPFLLRGGFGLHIEQVGLILGVMAGPIAIVGTLAGGVISDSLGKRSVRAYMIVPALALALTGVFFIAGLMANDVRTIVIAFGLGNLCMLAYTGPSWGTLHNIVPSEMRASAVATLSVIVAVVGAGFGPIMTGWLSDRFENVLRTSNGVSVCTEAGGFKSAACAEISYLSLRDALVVTMVLFLVAGLFYYLASRSIARDLVITGAN